MASLKNKRQLWQFQFPQHHSKRLDRSRYLAISIALTYAGLSILWIVGSDTVLGRLFTSSDVLTELQILKGWFFVACTSLILYGLILRGVRQLQRKQCLLESIINSTNDAIFVKDDEGNFLVINQTALHLLETGFYTAGRADSGTFDDAAVQQMEASEQEIFRTGKPKEIEELVNIKGEFRWFSTIKSLCLDERSRPIGIVGISRDITQRKQSEACLRDNEERLRLALTAAKQGLYDVNIPTGETIVNPEYATMLGYDPAQFHETTDRWIDRLHPDDRERLALTYQRYVTGDIPEYNVEFRQRTQTGDWKWILSLGKIVAWDNEGNPLRMLGTHTDISDRKQAEAELRRSEALRGELKLLENILEIILAGYWDWDIPGHQEYLSPTFKRMFGYDDDELPNTPETWQKLIFAEDLTTVLTCFELHVQSRGEIPYYNEVRYRHKDGSTVWVICSGQVIEWDANGNPLRAIGCHINITQRKQAEEALAAYTHAVEDLYNNAPCGYHSLDAEGRYVNINTTELEWLGYTREEMIGQPFTKFMADYNRPFFAQNYPTFKVRGWVKDLEFDLICKDGTLFPVLLSATAVKNADGTYLHSRSTLYDRRDRKQVEAQLRLSNERISMANAELARATRLKDEFLANMSHELRTPLTSIIGMAEVLMEQLYGELNEKQYQYVNVISQSGHHLLMLINDILDLAKIESGKMELEIIPTSIEDLCRFGISFVKQLAYQKNIQLETRVAKNITQIYVDELRIRQALINLLSNAIKFTPEGGQVTLEVTLKSSATEPSSAAQAMIAFNVIDTGIGIAAENLPKLFQSFIQIDSSLNRQYGGTGLGLSLVKKIAQMHHGSVNVVSTVGKGSCFTLTLPLHHQDDLTQHQTTSTDHPLLVESSMPTDDSRVASVAPPLILLVEDNQTNIDTFSDYLISNGFRLIIAHDGIDAVTLAQDHHPDLILMDMQLPKVDGLQATRQIRANQDLTTIPIIALTALAMAGDREKCLEAGVTEYLSKPISLNYLVRSMHRLLALPSQS